MIHTGNRGAGPLRSCACLCLALALAGCVSPNVGVDKAVSSLRAGDDPPALEWAEKRKRSFYSQALACVDAGRVRMLSGDFLGSSTNFAAVIDTIIDTSEAGPVIKLGGVGASVMAATITDDRTRAYEVPAYEFVQALQYQMLNHLFLGRPDSAAVEARRAIFAQDKIAEKYGKEVQDARVLAESQNGAQLGKVDEQMQGMAPVLEMTRSSFENGLVWYLSGMLLEEQEDIANAALAFRKAWELTPGNPYVQRDFLRLLRTQDLEAFKPLAAQAGVAPQSLVRPRTEVVVILEESFVSQRKSVKIPLPVGVAVLSVDFPTYQDAPYAPMALEVDTGRGGEAGAVALSLQALAYRDLKEKIPGIVVRNVTRALTRVAAQEVARAQDSDALKLAVLATTAVATAINRADTRAWYTLPMVSQVYRGGIAPGEQKLTLRNRATGGSMTIPLKVTEGETRIVWVADLGGNARVATASLNGKGAPATFHVCGSLLSGIPATAMPGGPGTANGASANGCVTN